MHRTRKNIKMRPETVRFHVGRTIREELLRNIGDIESKEKKLEHTLV